MIPSWRKQGIGEELVSVAISRARESGAKTMKISTVAENTELNDWYHRLGFVDMEIKKFEHLPFDVLYLQNRL